ncbi:chemotaxis protein CheW [Thiolapillus sp.]|uniref:chemotaxis protein CheW n=1 Tax=Thiolapillus sp. TaxID=2017437 RepID=UPI0025F1F289|nr:chemotaxis protein CheW [Thiolapillus sp.]
MHSVDTGAATDFQGLLIPQRQMPLLLPSSAVIEILGYREVSESAADASWILGSFSWRNLVLPLVSMERVLGVEREGKRGRKRIIVVHVFSDKLKTPFMGIEATGMPRLVSLNEETLEVLDGEPWPDDWPISDRVKVQDLEALIPDLDRLGALLQKVTP